MTDRPILFSDLMIRALLDGRKTQTRRVLNRLTRFGPITEFGYSDTNDYDWHFRDKEMRWHDLRHSELEKVLPYAPGDRLWIREAWSGEYWLSEIAPSERIGAVNYDRPASLIPETWYWADGSPTSGDWEKPRSSIHMPRWASRLTLTVTDVRVQRLQDIGDEDAEAEGVEGWNVPTWGDDYEDWWRNYQQPDQPFEGSPLDSFRTLWNSINGPDAWASNPWVVALTFDVHQQNIDHMRDAA